MKTEHRIYVALAVLLLAAAGLYLTQKSEQKELSQHSSAATSADLPPIGVPKDEVEKITKLQIKNADKSDVTLEKKGDAWEVTAPVSAKANASNVRSLLDNLRDLKAKESIDRTNATYAQYDLTDEKAVHVTAYKGADKAIDLYFGKSGSRGQMARQAGKDGVFIAGGYSSYLYTREVKNWRETNIFKFEDANVIQVEVANKNGLFSFSKNDEKWSHSFTKRGKDGKLESAATKWEKFEESKLKDMIRAYKNLNAEDFADDKATDTGLDKPEENGGMVRIVLKDNAGDFTLNVGKTAKGSSRYATKKGGDITYVVSSWSADWATAEQTKFEKADKKDDKKKPEGHGDEEEHMELDAPSDE